MEERERRIIWREDDNEGEKTIALSASEQHGSVEKGMRTEEESTGVLTTLEPKSTGSEKVLKSDIRIQ